MKGLVAGNSWGREDDGETANQEAGVLPEVKGRP